MASLFRQNDFRYTEAATEIERELHTKPIREVFKAYYELGYSPREIYLVIQMLANEISLEYILDAGWAMEKYKNGDEGS